MDLNAHKWLLAGIVWAFAGCSTSRFDPPELLGPIAVVSDADEPRLWALTKQEEVRTVGVGGGSRRSVYWRDDTFFHFELKAFDAKTARPLWTKRLLTIGDPAPNDWQPSRVIGSAADGQMLGQDGEVVWLLIDNQPLAVSAADGSVVVDSTGIEERNPALKDLLPVEARHYGFDEGLVFTSADARRFVLRGPDFRAIPFTPKPAIVPAPELMANEHPRIAPMLPVGEVPARDVTLGGQWLGLYSEKEAADLSNDDFGTKYRYPYSVADEGSQVRRTFWRGRVVTAQRFDEKFERFAEVKPIPGAPTLLRGRFLKDLATDQPLVLDAPAGVIVWHSTRIDIKGRLMLTRLDLNLKPVWAAELPLSERSIGNPVRYWLLPGRLVVTGLQESVSDGITNREPHLVSIGLVDGKWQAWNLEREMAVP